MRILLVWIVLCGAAGAGAAEPDADWLPRIVAAHFQSIEPRTLRTLSFSENVVVHAVNQSRRPGPPWDRSHGRRRYAIGFEPRRFGAEVRIREAGGYDFHYRVALDGTSGSIANFIDGYRRTLGPEAWPSRTADVFRRTPAWIVRELAASGEARVQPLGGSSRRLRFESSAGPLELEFDRRWRLSHTRWQEADGDVEVEFDDYSWRDGVAVPGKMTLYWRGERVNDIRVRDVAVNEAVEQFLEPPGDLPLLEMPDAAGARDFAVRELGEGLWFIGEGVHYQLFVEMEDHVVALGSVAGAARRLAALRERIGDKPVRHVLVTHHHGDHLEGIAELAETGAVLLAAPEHAAVVRDAAGGSAHVKLDLVRGTRTLGDGRRSIRIIDIGPNVHAEQMLVAYLPAQKLLWSADLFVQPPERPLRSAIEPIRALAAAIRIHGLDVDLLLDPHSPRINTMAELRESVAKSGMR